MVNMMNISSTSAHWHCHCEHVVCKWFKAAPCPVQPHRAARMAEDSVKNLCSCIDRIHSKEHMFGLAGCFIS